MNPRVKAFWFASLLLLLLSYYLGLVNGYETGSADSGMMMNTWIRVTKKTEMMQAAKRGESVPMQMDLPDSSITDKRVNGWITDYLLETHRAPVIATTKDLDPDNVLVDTNTK